MEKIVEKDEGSLIIIFFSSNKNMIVYKLVK